MFFCDECADKKGWPKSLCKSCGTCEICGETASCSDIPSRALPLPKDLKKEEFKEKLYALLDEYGLVESIKINWKEQ